MGNRTPVAEAIKEKMPGYEVKHACGLPLCVWSEVDGKKGKTECAPLYFNVPACYSKNNCKGAIDKTAANAAAVGGGAAPAAEAMER